MLTACGVIHVTIYSMDITQPLRNLKTSLENLAKTLAPGPKPAEQPIVPGPLPGPGPSPQPKPPQPTQIQLPKPAKEITYEDWKKVLLLPLKDHDGKYDKPTSAVNEFVYGRALGEKVTNSVRTGIDLSEEDQKQKDAKDKELDRRALALHLQKNYGSYLYGTTWPMFSTRGEDSLEACLFVANAVEKLSNKDAYYAIKSLGNYLRGERSPEPWKNEIKMSITYFNKKFGENAFTKTEEQIMRSQLEKD